MSAAISADGPVWWFVRVPLQSAQAQQAPKRHESSFPELE
jgi:hypothetical protein